MISSLRIRVGAAILLAVVAAGTTVASFEAKPTAVTTTTWTRPTAATTGYTGSLTTYSGSLTITASNRIFSNVDFPGYVKLTGSNIVLSNCHFDGMVFYGPGPLTVRNCTSNGGINSDAYYRAINSVTFDHVHGIEGAHDGIDVYSSTSHRVTNVRIVDSLFDGMNFPASSTAHGDGIQVRGVAGLDVERTVFNDGPYQPQDNSAIYFENVNGGDTAMTLTDIDLYGGGYTFYTNAVTSSTATNVAIVQGGHWGAYYSRAQPSGWVFVNVTGSTGNQISPSGGSTSSPPPPTPIPSGTPTPAPTGTPTPVPTGTPMPTPTPTGTPTPTPAPTSTPTPTPPPTGTPAPGTGWTRPTASTTGYSGTLSAYTGSLTLTANNQTFSNVDFGGYLVLSGANIVLNNCHFGGMVFYGPGPLTVTHCTSDGGVNADGWYRAVSGVTLDHVHVIEGAHDGFDVFSSSANRVSNVTVLDSLFDGMNFPAGSTAHGDGMQIRGVGGLDVERTVFNDGPYQSQDNSAIYFENVNGGDTGMTLTDLDLYGGGYTFYTNAVSASSATNVRIVQAGHWGAYYSRAQPSGWSFTNVTGPSGNQINP